MRHESEKGQAIAEFAIVFPVLLLVVLGIIQISLMFVARAVVEYSAFAAARAELVGESPEQAATMICSAIAGPSYARGTGQTVTVPGWGALPRSESASLKTTVDVADPMDDQNGQVVVEVTHLYELSMPVASLLFKPLASPLRAGDVPAGLFVTVDDAPHIVLRVRYTRPVPWDDELQTARGHAVIPDL